MKNLLFKIRERFKMLVFKLFIKFSNELLDETESIVFAEKVMRKYYKDRFFPVEEIPVKKGEIRYTLLVSADGKKFNLGRNDVSEIINESL
jgi:hypothetical protein